MSAGRICKLPCEIFDGRLAFAHVNYPLGRETDQGGALHDGLLSPIRGGHGQLREVHEHLCHLIASLAAAHVHDAVTVAVLGQRLGNDRLAAAESTWDGACSCRTQDCLIECLWYTEARH